MCGSEPTLMVAFQPGRGRPPDARARACRQAPKEKTQQRTSATYIAVTLQKEMIGPDARSTPTARANGGPAGVWMPAARPLAQSGCCKAVCAVVVEARFRKRPEIGFAGCGCACGPPLTVQCAPAFSSFFSSPVVVLLGDIHPAYDHDEKRRVQSCKCVSRGRVYVARQHGHRR